MRIITTLFVFFLFSLTTTVFSLARPDVEFKIFQFPPDRIPRIDGDPSDWDIVPDDYIVGTEELVDLVRNSKIDKKDFDVKVRVGWVKGMNRLYFLYEAYDDYWNFDNNTLLNDLFEPVIDADLSDWTFNKHLHPDAVKLGMENLHFTVHGVSGQNYHIFTPPGEKDWCYVWGCERWAKRLPWANSACTYDFKKSGDSGHLVLEFWITPFDYAPADNPGEAIPSTLVENRIIGLTWGISDYDSTGKDPGNVDLNSLYDAQWNLSHDPKWYGIGSSLCAFRLMPLEQKFVPKLKAFADFKIIDMERRVVAFKDLSIGNITKWTWDFGGGEISHEQHPIHTFSTPGGKPVLLTVEGPDGSSQFPFVYEEIFLK